MFLFLVVYLLLGTSCTVKPYFLSHKHRSPLRKLALKEETFNEQQIFCKHVASLGLKSNIQILHSAKSRIKAYCISDLHADSKNNFQWTLENCVRKADDSDVFTILIVPGDLGSETEILDKIFSALVQQYDAVCYVPGNHEVWRRGTATGGSVLSVESADERRARNDREAVNSLMKYKEVMLLAEKRAIHTTPLYVSSQGRGVWVVPFQSWFHSNWDTEPDLTHPDYLKAQKVIPFTKMWSDFWMCSWPADLLSHDEFVSIDGNNDVLARFFDSINDGYMSDINITHHDTVLSFSHFVPREELCPEKRFLLEPLLSRVIGSVYLEKRIRLLKPHLHMFGHTHIPIDLTIDGVRYLQWPLGTHKESKRQCALIHNSGPLLVYDSALGVGVGDGIPVNLASEHVHWTQYYRHYERTPNVTDVIAPWVQKRLDRFRGLIESATKTATANESNPSLHE